MLAPSHGSVSVRGDDLFRWFVGLDLDDPVWTPTTFTKNRDRLLAGDIARRFFEAVRAQAHQARLLSDEHFTVDGTLLEAWASFKSFRRKERPSDPPPDDPGNPTVNFHGERRSNETHASTTDPDCRLFRKSKGHEAKLAYQDAEKVTPRGSTDRSRCTTMVAPSIGACACAATTSRRPICLVICRRSNACQRIIRCARSDA